MEVFDDLSRILAAEFDVFGAERHGSDHGMAAAAVTFADLGNVMDPRPRRPRI